MKSLQIAGNLRSPEVNGVHWDHILDRQSPNDPVLSNFSFTSAFVSHDIISNDINGLDLSDDVVLVNTSQTIHGEIRIYGRLNLISDMFFYRRKHQRKNLLRPASWVKIR